MSDSMLESARDEQGRRLVDWLRARGATIGALEVRRHANGQRGVHTTAHVSSGEIVVRLPRRCLVTREDARASSIGRRLSAAGLRPRSGHTWLAAFLADAKRSADTEHRPYVDTLPSSVRDLPVCFSDEELDLLRGSFVRERIEERRRALVAEYRDIARSMPDFDAFSARELVAARLIVGSRAFGICVSGKKTEALVPFADLFNHRPHPDVEWSFDQARNEFVMIAARAIEANREVHDSYGSKPNAQLFLHYGFCLGESARDEAVVTFADVADDHPSRRHCVGLGVSRGESRRFVVTKEDDEASRRMLSYLCLATTTRGGGLRRPDARVSSLRGRARRSVWASLRDACLAALARFDTTYAEDLELIEHGELSRRARTCVRVRMCEKRVLEHHLRLAELRLAELSGGRGIDASGFLRV